MYFSLEIESLKLNIGGYQLEVARIYIRSHKGQNFDRNCDDRARNKSPIFLTHLSIPLSNIFSNIANIYFVPTMCQATGISRTKQRITFCACPLKESQSKGPLSAFVQCFPFLFALQVLPNFQGLNSTSLNKEWHIISSP